MAAQKARPPNYSDVEFWDSRYGKDGPAHAQGNFDWFPWQNGKDPILKALEDAGVPKGGRVLDIGCGNSLLPNQLLDQGYGRVVGIDFSPVVVQQMLEQRSQTHGTSGGGEDEGDVPADTLHFFVMDARTLSFSDGTFDAVLDKGLMDSVLANHDRIELWKKVRANRAPDPLHVQQGEDSLETVQAVLGEISRILKPGGVYAAVSHEKPERRLPVIRASMSEHKVSHSAYDAEKEFYMYTAVK